MRGDEQAPEGEPVILRNLALGNGDITAKPRLRRQQIVKARVTPAFGGVEAGGEQVARLVEQEGEIHRGQFIALARQGLQGKQALAGMSARLKQTIPPWRE